MRKTTFLSTQLKYDLRSKLYTNRDREIHPTLIFHNTLNGPQESK